MISVVYQVAYVSSVREQNDISCLSSSLCKQCQGTK